MTILVTGCAGFIGSKVASQLLDMGHTVLGVDSLAQVQHNRLQEWRLAALHQHPSFTFRRVDISDFSQLKSIFGGDGREGRVSSRHQSRSFGRGPGKRVISLAHSMRPTFWEP